MKSEPPDELTLAIQAARLYHQAVDELVNDLVKSKLDMRVITKKTRETMLVAVSKYNQLIRMREMIKGEMELKAHVNTKGKH